MFSISIFPPLGGLTFKIWHASWRVRPDEAKVVADPDPPFLAAAAAYFWDAWACFQASLKARPKTRAPVKITWATIRWAWGKNLARGLQNSIEGLCMREIVRTMGNIDAGGGRRYMWRRERDTRESINREVVVC